MNLNKDKAPENNQEANHNQGSASMHAPAAPHGAKDGEKYVPPAKEQQDNANQAQAQNESGPVPMAGYDDRAPIGDLIETKPYQMSEKAKALRKHLASQPLVRVLVIREPNEAKDALLSFSVNGYNFFVAKGKYSQVPEDVAAMIQDTYKQGEAVLADHPLNLSNNTAAANEFKR